MGNRDIKRAFEASVRADDPIPCVGCGFYERCAASGSADRVGLSCIAFDHWVETGKRNRFMSRVPSPRIADLTYRCGDFKWLSQLEDDGQSVAIGMRRRAVLHILDADARNRHRVVGAFKFSSTRPGKAEITQFICRMADAGLQVTPARVDMELRIRGLTVPRWNTLRQLIKVTLGEASVNVGQAASA